MTHKGYVRRRQSHQVRVDSVSIGGGAQVSVQSMTNTDTRDVESTLRQISELVAAGAHLVRVAVPDAEASRTLEQIVRHSPVPVIADIHFDHRLALMAISAGAAKIRINPGNFRSEHLDELVRAASEAGIPMRIGVNAGSLPGETVRELGVTADAMVQTAIRYIEMVQSSGFDQIVLSAKASDVPLTVEANEELARLTAYPIHLGITEAGTGRRAEIKSAVGIGHLLGRGIGDTIRVSLTGDPVREVEVARAILATWGLAPSGVNLVSCPTCGRCRVDMETIASEVGRRLKDVEGDLTVAVMGCEVNGPGEARHADVGLACGQGTGVVMRGGEIKRKVDEKDMVDELMREVHRHLQENPPEKCKDM